MQLLYERDLRPPEKRHEAWVERVSGQIVAAYTELEEELARAPLSMDGSDVNQAGISTAVAWNFTQLTVPDAVSPAQFPRLVALSEYAESLPAFRAAPHGGSTYRMGMHRSVRWRCTRTICITRDQVRGTEY